MKKLYLIPILFFLTLTFCTDNNDVAPLSEQIKGEWHSVRNTHKYYNEDNQEIHVWTYLNDRTLNFKDTAYVEKSPWGYPYGIRYFLSESKGKNYITIGTHKHNPFELIISGTHMA